MSTKPQWTLLLSMFLFVAGLRDVGMQLSTLLELPTEGDAFASYQYWFAAGSAALVGLLKGITAFVAWRRPVLCRRWFLGMTAGIVVAALLRSAFGARLWHALHDGPRLFDALSAADWRASLVGMLAASAPYFAVVGFLFTGERRRFFGQQSRAHVG